MKDDSSPEGVTAPLVRAARSSIARPGAWTRLAAALATAVLALAPLGCGGRSRPATIVTDKLDYPPGQTVVITGAGWRPGETVTIVLERHPATHGNESLTSVADASGKFTNTSFAPKRHDLGVRFDVTARGVTSGLRAQTMFTDGPKTWTGATSSDWGTAGNWSPSGAPTSADDVTVPANVASGVYPVVGGTANALTVTLASGAGTQPTLTVSSGTLTVAGNFTVNAGTVAHSGGTIAVTAGLVSITGTLNESGGTFLSSVTLTVNSGGNVNVSGTGILHMAPAIGTNPTKNITIAAGGTITQSGGSVDVYDFTTSSGSPNGTYNQSSGTFKEYHNFASSGTFNATGGTVEFAANPGAGTFPATLGPTQFFNVLCGADPDFDANAAVSFSVAGDWTANTNVDMSGNAVTVTFNGTGAQTIGGTGTTTFTSVTVNKASGTATLAHAETIKGGNLTVSSGTLDIAGFTFNRSAAGGTLTVSNGAFLKIGGTTNTFPTNFSTVTLGTTSTVEFYGTGAQTIPAYNYGHLTSSNSGARTLASTGTIGIAGTFTTGTNTYTTTGSTVEFNGSVTQTIPALNYNNITSSSTGARILASSGAVGIKGTFTNGTNSYTVTGSTVDYNGTGAQTIVAMTYDNLTVSGATASNKTCAGQFDVTGTLTYNNTSTGFLVLNNTTSLRTFNLGHLVMTAGVVNPASQDVGAAGSIATQVNIGGNMTIGATGYLSANCPTNVGGVTFTGTGNVNIAAGGKYEYMVTRIAGTANVTMQSNWTFLDDVAPLKTILTVDTGSTLNASTYKVGIGTLANTIAINGLFQTANTTGFSGAAGTAISSTNSPVIALGSASTIEYNGGGAQTVTARSYANLTFSNAGTKTIAAGATSLTGNLAVNGSAAADATTNSTTVTLNGSTNQSIAGITFYNLTENNAAGATITGNATVNNTMTFTSGNITTNANTLAIGSSGTVSRTSGHVIGNLRKWVPTGATSRTFEVGGPTNYRPVDVAFASVTTAGNLTATSTAAAGDHPNIGTSTIDPAKTANRYWTLTNSGIVFTTCSATFTFVAGDLDGGANTSNFIVGQYSGSWTYPTVGTRTGTSTQATGLTSFSDFQCGEGAIFTTLGNGTDPSNASLAPGGAATMDDAFTFVTSAGTDSVTAVTVTLSAGSSGGLSLVEITNDAGSTVYGSVANPASDAPSITLGTAITATTSSTQYKIRITPKSHANMPAPPGSTYSVTASISGWTGTNYHAGSDTAGTTVTIDNLSPGDVTSADATPGDTQVSLAWTNPADSDLHGVVVLRRAGSAVADVPAEGTTYVVGNVIGTSTVACVVTAPTATCNDTGLTNGTAYHYKIFAKDSNVNYATGTVPAGSPATPGPYHADAMIKLSSEADAAYLADDVYEATATTQSKSQGVISGSTAVYRIRFQNDGILTDSLLITGTATGSSFTVQYLDDLGTDRTAAVTGAGYTISSLAVQATKVWTLNVTPSGVVAGGTSYTVLVTATSVADTSKTDQVKGVTTSTSANLTLVKSADKSTANPGEEVTYTVTASNASGLTDASTIVVSDPIPSYTGFKVGSASFNPGTSGLTCGGGCVTYSNDGGTSWTYTPASGGCSAPAGYDHCVTNVRWTPAGSMPTATSFTVVMVVRVK